MSARTEHLSGIETEMALVGKEASTFFLSLEAKSSAIEEDKERSFRSYHFDFICDASNTFSQQVNIALDIGQHLASPLVAFFAVACFGTVEGKDIAEIHIAVVNVAEISRSQL